MEQVDYKSLIAGDMYNFPARLLTEKEIIDFAIAFDPLDFHTDKDAAKRSIFKRLIASGPHIFTVVHKEQWIPRFGHSVLAGLEVNNWKFLKPVYVDMPVFSSVTIASIVENKQEGHAVIKWLYNFSDNNETLLQTLDMTIMHKID